MGNYKGRSPTLSLAALAVATALVLSGVGYAQELLPPGISDSPSSEVPDNPEVLDPLAPGVSDLAPGLSGLLPFMLAAAPTPTELVYLPVTFFDYDKEAVNRSIRGGTSTLRDSELLLAGGDQSGVQNSWNDDDALQGIMRPDLDSATLSPRSLFGGMDWFGSGSAPGKTVYTGYRFPFTLDDEGYYNFDSAENHLHLPSGGGELTLHGGEGPTMQVNGQPAGGLRGPERGVGFFPLNNDTPSSKQQDANYSFGMSFSIPFTMRNGGYLDAKKTIPITFSFSGDDDVWVYIDGRLALDLGGIHGESGGEIDFSTLTVTADRVYGSLSPQGSGVRFRPNWGDSVTRSFSELGIPGFKGSGDSVHTLQFFYMERGAGESNCRMRFNCAQPEMSVTAGKALDKDLAAHGDPIVTFRLQRLDSKNAVIATTFQTLRFKNGDTARQETVFEGLEPGKYLLTELSTQRYRRGGVSNMINGVPSGDGVLFTLGKGCRTGSADFTNTKLHERYLSHTDLAVNTILLEPGDPCGENEE